MLHPVMHTVGETFLKFHFGIIDECQLNTIDYSFHLDPIKFIVFLEVSCSLLDSPLSSDHHALVGFHRRRSTSNYHWVLIVRNLVLATSLLKLRFNCPTGVYLPKSLVG